MGVLRAAVGEGSYLQTSAGRPQSVGKPQGFTSNIAATDSDTYKISNIIDKAGEEVTNAEDPAGIMDRQGLGSRSHQLWRRRQSEFLKSRPMARGGDSIESEELRIFNLKASSGQLSPGAVKVQDGPRPPTSPFAATEDPFRASSGNQKDVSNNRGSGQNNNQGKGPSGGQDSNQGQNKGQGKGFNQAGPSGPNENGGNQGPGQNGNQGNGFDQSGGPRPNQNGPGQNSGQNQGNNGNGNQAPDQGKNGKGDQSPKPKQNQNGNQNSDRTSETRPPKQTSTSDQTTSTIATSSPAVQTTEQPAQTTDPVPSSQPPPSFSAQTVQQPSQQPAITPSAQTSTASVGPSTSTSIPSSTLPFSTETQVPTTISPTSAGIGQPVAALDPTTSQVPETVVTQGSLQSSVPSNRLDSRKIIGISVGGASALVVIAALLWLFLKIRKRGLPSHQRKAWYRSRDMTGGTETEKRLSRAEMGASLVSQAAPVAGTLDNDQETIAFATERNGNNSLSEVQKPRYVAYRPERYKSRINDEDQDHSGRYDQENQYRMSTASNPFSLQDELRPTAPDSGSSSSPVAQADLVQQPEPAESKDCPFQRLQGKLRLHNSSDPRPPRHFSKKPIAVSRESVSTMSSSATGPSPHASARFSFGLLLQPSLDLFKFNDIRSSLGGRGSGWSLWFKKDDASNGKPPGHSDMGTK